MIFIDPSLKDAKREIDVVETYAANCSDVSLKTLYDALDIFAFAHFWGWGMKALMIRNYGICWTISVTWEVNIFLFNAFRLLIKCKFKVDRVSIRACVAKFQGMLVGPLDFGCSLVQWRWHLARNASGKVPRNPTLQMGKCSVH